MGSFKTRKWQRRAFNIIDSHAGGVVPVNACVGSGKTAVACYAFGRFIVDNIDNRTVQMFITPRIRLCDQQNNEIESFLESEFNLKNGVDFAIIGVDCTKRQFNRKNDRLESRHTIFVVCDESLWGRDKGVNPDARWRSWLHKFGKWQNAGFRFGWIALDESHNYEKNERLMLSDKDTCLANWFSLMPMSGTPAAYQREWTKKWPKNACVCSPKEAMANGWICRPILNLVIGDKNTGWARAIVAVLNKEKTVCENEVFKPRLMLNCSGIDDIKQIVGLEWIKAHVKKDFHLITLHSTKGYDDGNGLLNFAKPTIDCEDVDADEAYKAIEAIDGDSYFKDDLPIVVAQVAMLGEGINVSSFNAILTASNAEKTAMQQIGRCIRNYRLGEKEKVVDGHANVYVLTDNVCSIRQLLVNLEEYDLTDECFQWGDKIDVMTGSSPEDLDDDVVPTLNSSAWDSINPEHDLDIIEMMRSMKSKLYRKAVTDMFNSIFGDNDKDGKADVDELGSLLESLSKSGVMKLWSKYAFGKNELTVKAKEKTEKPEGGGGGKSPVDDKVKAKKSNPAYDVFMKWLFDIRRSLRSSSSAKKLWDIDKTLCVEAILQNREVAEFLIDHIAPEKLDKLAR